MTLRQCGVDSADFVQVLFSTWGVAGGNAIQTFQGILMSFYNWYEISFTSHLIEEVSLVISNCIVVENRVPENIKNIK